MSPEQQLPDKIEERFSQSDIEQLNQFEGYLSFIPTWSYRIFVNLPHKITFLNAGNQALKTASTAKQYVDRILSRHPIPKKNIVYWECERRAKIHRREIDVEELLKTHKSKDSATWNSLQRPSDAKCPECGGAVVEHERGSRTFRFASETLPGESGNVSKDGMSAEVKNTTYPEFKKWLPKFLIKKDITSRNKSMIIKDIFGGADILIDFVSYNQPPQGTAGPQRCVAKGQRVLKSSGVWTNIEDINIGDELVYEALGGHGSRQRVNRVAKTIYNGKQKVYRFNCQKGISFEVTGNHPVMIPGKGRAKYKKSGDLSIGDRVTCKLSNIKGIDTLEKWQLVLLGVVLGDGTLTGSSIKFACKNDEFADDVEQWLPKSLKLRKYQYSDDRTPEYFISKTTLGGKNEFMSLIKELGLKGKVAGTKFVPNIIFEQSNKSIALFLRYLFTTDGWASHHSVGYCSTSYRLTQDVYLLLRRLGIRSNIHKKTFVNNWNDQWWICISQAYDVLNFFKQVGMVAKDKYITKVKKEAERRIKSRHDVCSFKTKGLSAKDSKSLPQSVKIKSIEFIGVKDVYDLTMERGTEIKKMKRGKLTKMMDYRSPKDNFLIQGGVVVHNCSIWLDEQSPIAFFEEQYPGRLVAEDGDLVISCTPADRISWLYDEVFEKAAVYFRTDAVIEAYARLCDQPGKLQVEHTNSPFDIAVIQASTDDNPTLVLSVINDMYKDIDEVNHPETLAIRRYGIFKQISGRIFKGFVQGTHIISSERYFPHGVPENWVHGRAVDYHQSNPWACGAMSLSPQNELFIWGEQNPSPHAMHTAEICERFAKIGDNLKFYVNLIDPLAATKQPNTGFSTLDDFNRIFHSLYLEGKCKPASWQTWDTKSQVGRDAIKTRLKNSTAVGEPFNNRIEIDGREAYLPTIWVFDYCVNFSRSIKNWRLEEWANTAVNQSKDAKETPQQKWSHFCMVIEGLLKYQGFKPRNPDWQPRKTSGDKYFQGGSLSRR